MAQITPIPIEEEVKSSYLDYAMSVIVSRALPDVRDGLKPVQRRILYGMWRLGLKHDAKFAKSARIVGAIMGYYHPHGDSPIYEALARMTQDFSMRHPLIIGQGNWGSLDGDPPAAQRYTEAKLAPIAEEFLEEIDQETVEWKNTFDGTRKEPEFLPAKLPHLLLNGAQGIAVGMATNIPPHNLNEVGAALMYLIDHPDAPIEKILPFIKGPDFPTAGIIYDQEAIRQAYVTGRGAIPIRARATIEERKKGRYITITELPYQVGKADLIQEIAQLVRDGKIEGIQDIIDGSRKDVINIVIELKRGANGQKVLNQLYHHTRLQRNFNVLMIALVDGIEPRLLSLIDFLHFYLSHRELTIRRRTAFDLRQAKEREHILEGLALALSHIDEVIALIKSASSKEEAKLSLQKQFTLSEVQAQAILQMRLQTLARLERNTLIKELEEKKTLIAKLEEILASPKKVKHLIKKELAEGTKRFGQARKTQVISESLAQFKPQDLIPQEKVLIMLTKEGYIKRFSPKAFHQQGRGGIGVIGISLVEGDVVFDSVSAMSHDELLFFSKDGRLYGIKAYQVPERTRTAKGEGLYEFFEPSAPICDISVAKENMLQNPESFLVAMSAKGLIKKVSLRTIGKIPRRGIKIMGVGREDECLRAFITAGSSELLSITANGQSLRFSLREVRPMGRGAAGVKGMRVKQGDHLIELLPIENNEDHIVLVTEKGYGKMVQVKAFSLHHRGTIGMRALRVTAKTGKVKLALRVLPGEQSFFINTMEGKIIKINRSHIPLLGRGAQGVRLIKLKEGDRVASALLL